MITFIIIGGGWRSEFYLRIAKALPEKFHISAACIRNQKRAEEIARKYHVSVVRSMEEVFEYPFDFIVNCINKEDISALSVELADQGHFVLCETPIDHIDEAGHAYEKIQVAEQFHLKGMWQAVKKIIDSGIIGKVNHINLSVAHDYHAMSLLRFFLNDYEKPELLFTHHVNDTMIHTNGRTGALETKTMIEATQVIKMYQFRNATAIYDYHAEQYFSPIRKDRILIRGSRGEILNHTVRHFNERDQLVTSEIQQSTAGLLDGFFLDKIIFENQVLFEYPEKQARLSEEELAVAQCLCDMKTYVESGKELYSFQRAYQDYCYFNL